eukprot:scaffold49490_cov14-Prasinocladus_malaysianus.AAC.1
MFSPSGVKRGETSGYLSSASYLGDDGYHLAIDTRRGPDGLNATNQEVDVREERSEKEDRRNAKEGNGGEPRKSLN